MLVEAFGLRRDPFMDTADPSFYYETIGCANARRRFGECLVAGRGLAVLVGPIGAGKTTLCNAVQHDVLSEPAVRAGLILDPTFSGEAEFYATIAASLEIEIDTRLGHRDVKEALKRSLFASVGASRQYVLFIDEAQLLPEELLESLRALLNYQIDDRKLLAVALAGQMELAAALGRHPSLSDRVATWLELGPLAESEAAALLDHRLRVAGFAASRSPFSAESASLAWRLSGGLPRRLTALAREAMEVAAERGARSVEPGDIGYAARRLPPTAVRTVATPIAAQQPSRRWPWSWFAQ
jgi:type II secretory pathway predicted ATPase ExeA